MKKNNTKISNKILAIVLTVIAAFTVMGCSTETIVSTAEVETEPTELITYEFETFDNVKVVIDENSIIAQEFSEDPEHSKLVSAKAAGNIIAPGRDFVYMEDDNNYYVADIYRKLITVADKSKATVDEEKTFGLKDYEGFYCRIDTEEIEDYEVTYAHGYQFNGDGTGVAYEQDVVDFTWNETEMHFASSTETFVMEPGRLTVGGITYDKIYGEFITPNPCDVDVDNVENGIYHAYIDRSGINEADGQFNIWTEIFTEDSYDIVDINRMAEGDVIYINGVLMPVYSIEKTDSGIININGGVENNGSALIADDESNCYVYAGMDMERSYTRQGIANLAVSSHVKLIDRRNPSEEKEYTGSDAVSVLREMVEEYPLNCHNCSIMVENGEIVEINRLYTP